MYVIQPHRFVLKLFPLFKDASILFFIFLHCLYSRNRKRNFGNRTTVPPPTPPLGHKLMVVVPNRGTNKKLNLYCCLDLPVSMK